MTPGRHKEVRALKRHLRDLLLHRANLLGVIALIERAERPAKPRGPVRTPARGPGPKTKTPH